MRQMKRRLNVKFRIETCKVSKKKAIKKHVLFSPGWGWGSGHICNPSTQAALEGSQKDQPAHDKLRGSLGFRVSLRSAWDA